MILEILTAILVAMIAAIIWLLRDDAIFWADAQRAAKGEKTRKYFKNK